MNNDDVVCGCMNVTVQDIKDAINNGAKSFEAVQEAIMLAQAAGIA